MTLMIIGIWILYMANFFRTAKHHKKVLESFIFHLTVRNATGWSSPSNSCLCAIQFVLQSSEGTYTWVRWGSFTVTRTCRSLPGETFDI